MKQMLFVLILVGVIALSGCARTQQQTAPEVTAQLESPEDQEPATADAQEPAAQATEQPEVIAGENKQEQQEKPQLAPEYSQPNSVTVSEKTVIGSAADVQKKEEKTSWFSNVVCGKFFPDGESMVTFTIENKGKKEYQLTRIGVEEVTEKDAMRIQLNSNRVTEPQKECGTEVLKPGQKATCTVKEKLLKGKTYWQKELVNKLAGNTVGLYTELKFTCEGMVE